MRRQGGRLWPAVPWPYPNKNWQTIGMPIKPVLQFPKSQGLHSWPEVVKNLGDRGTESAEDTTLIPDVSL